LTDWYYWPNLYNDVAFFVILCTICQLHSRQQPKIPFPLTWNSTTLQHFDLDTIFMPHGFGGMVYLLQVTEPSITWPDAHALKNNTSEAWASFIYKDIICCFSCIPFFLVHGGSEFKGVAEILFKQYGITVIMTTAYMLHNNSVAKWSHPTLFKSLMHASGQDESKWPLFLYGCLLAMRCTTSCMTGFPPYFLLYSRNPLLAFNTNNCTWDTSDWHKVQSMANLIATRA